MKKIYIDFKITSLPIFIDGVPRYQNYPFAASIAIMDGDFFKPSSIIFELRNEDYKEISISLLEHIKKLSGNHSLSYKDLEIYSWNSFTSQNIFNKMNINIQTKNIADILYGGIAPEISLEKITSDFDEDRLFEYTYEIISNSRYFMAEMKKDAKKNFHKDGDLKTISIASLIGTILYVQNNIDFAWKYNLDTKIDFDKVKFELNNYCLSTVKRLSFAFENKSTIKSRFNKINELNGDYKHLRAENDMLNSIKPSAQLLLILKSVEDYIFHLQSKINEYKENIRATYLLDISDEDKKRTEVNINQKIEKINSKIIYLKSIDPNLSIHNFIFEIDKQILLLKNKRNQIQNIKNTKLHVE